MSGELDVRPHVIEVTDVASSGGDAAGDHPWLARFGARVRGCDRAPCGSGGVRRDIRQWTEMPRGGHFAALEQPELFVDDVRTFFELLRT